ATPAGTVPLNTWSHVGLTYDGSVVRLYVNGVARGTSAVHFESFSNPLKFGYAIGPSDNYFQGRLDEVSLYRRALGATKLQASYNAGSAGLSSTNAVLIISTMPAGMHSITATY